MVFAGVLVFLGSNFEPLLELFTPEFSDRAAPITWVLLAFGIALTGPEVVEGVERVLASIRGVFKS